MGRRVRMKGTWRKVGEEGGGGCWQGHGVRVGVSRVLRDGEE